MNKLAYLIIILAYTFLFIMSELPGGRLFRLAPEMLSAFVMVIVALRIGKHVPIAISPKYLVFFVIFLLSIMAGIAMNSVQPGAVFSGMLIYFRYIPFFLLPVVYEFSEEDISSQLKLLLGLALLQFPISFMQRFYVFSGGRSGDSVIGTLGLSSHLSIVLIGSAAVLLGFYLKERITTRRLILLLAVLLMPTMINETTVSLFLIPIALIVPVLFVQRANKFRYIMSVSGVVMVLLVVFVAIYDSYYSRWGESIVSGIYEGKMLEYVYRGADKDSRTDREKEQSEIGRVDSMVLPFKLINDPVKLLLGHGMGNVSDISSERLMGEYIGKYGVMGAGMTTVAYLIWETGLVGLFLSVLVLLLILGDAAALSREGGTYGALGLGWCGVIVIMLVLLTYQNNVPVVPIGILMWYLSGVVVSQRFRVQRLRQCS